MKFTDQEGIEYKVEYECSMQEEETGNIIFFVDDEDNSSLFPMISMSEIQRIFENPEALKDFCDKTIPEYLFLDIQPTYYVVNGPICKACVIKAKDFSLNANSIFLIYKSPFASISPEDRVLVFEMEDKQINRIRNVFIRMRKYFQKLFNKSLGYQVHLGRRL